MYIPVNIAGEKHTYHSLNIGWFTLEGCVHEVALDREVIEFYFGTQVYKVLGRARKGAV